MSDDTNLPATIEGVNSEIAAIQGEMGDRNSVYWKDEGRQARYRALIRHRDGDREPTILTGNELSLKSIAEFRHANPQGDYGEYVKAMREYGDVFTHVSDPEGFNAKCEALPDTVVEPMIVELMSRAGIASEPISDAMLAKLSREPGTERLAREWGHDARRRFGTVRARLLRAIDMMPGDGDVDRFDSFIKDLTPDETEAVFRKLAA